MTETVAASPRARWRQGFRRLLLLLLACCAAMSVWQVFKPLPAGIGRPYPLHPAGDTVLLTDVTYVDAAGVRRSDQQVFDEVLRLIGQARRAIVLDMFLFNDFAGADAAEPLRPLSTQLTRALIERKRAVPDLQVVVITDPINTLYGGLRAMHLEAMRQAGIAVVVTDLGRLRAPNPAWSGFWQLCCRWLGNDAQGGWLASPFGQDKVTLRSYLALLNLNANHRKTLVVDRGAQWTGLVASANPHDGSSAHGNVALRFDGPAVLDLLRSERAVVEMSSARWPLKVAAPAGFTGGTDGTQVQLLTEGRIGEALLASVNRAAPGDSLDIAVFYFSHRGLVRAVIAAQRRGVRLRVLLDPNEDAFGRKKNGIPNRQAALELHRAGVPLRWCDTHGEQCHAKFMLRRSAAGPAELIAGSANYTRRNLDDYNLETSARVLAPADTEAMRRAAAYFEQSWENTDGRRISLPYPRYADDSRLRYWRYRFTEATGLSSF
jgi:phosphatidylserine/phosphatidylglycerophosphate/cardiolipin synthase-like enzyme